MDNTNNMELLRERNQRELENFLNSHLENPEFEEAINALKSKPKPVTNKPLKKRADPNFTVNFPISVPVAERRSNRLAKKPARFSASDLIDNIKNKSSSDDEIENLEKVVFRKKKSGKPRNSEVFQIVLVESITDNYIARIAKQSKKTYSQNGTSCHQCRQKTLDSKTYCRNPTCIGVRGQFCGPCLKNRYGEDAATVLRDPNWKCPPCRNICNCSICRSREGKRPTGILAPMAYKYGYNSVKDFLFSLNVNDHKKKENDHDGAKKKAKPLATDSDEECFLGFDIDGKAVMVNKNKFNPQIDDV